MKAFLAVIIPLVFLIVTVYKYQVNIPYSDEWEMTSLIEKSYQNKLDLSDFWSTHNEHRVLFPKLILLAVARLTHWNISYELVINILLTLGIFITISYLVHKTFRKKKYQGNFLLFIFSIMVFSLNQFENWLLGWQITILLSTLAATIGIILLSNNNLSWRKVIVAAVLGVISSYSFATGVVYWPVCLLIIATNRLKKNRFFLIFWVIVSLMVIILFLYGHPYSLGKINIFQLTLYIITYLGRPLGTITYYRTQFSYYFGTVGIFLMSVNVFLLIKKKTSWLLLKPWVFLCLYAIGSAVITGWGRQELGWVQGGASRYIVISNLFWISNITIFIYLFFPTAKTATDKIFSYVTVLIFIILIIVASIHSLREFRDFSNHMKDLRRILFTGEGRNRLNKEFYNQVNVDERVKLLKKYQLLQFK